MTSAVQDPVAAFYERHPYPPPISDLTAYAESWQDPLRRRVEHHRLWPTLPYRDDHTILVAGCGTSQAAKYAARYPRARVLGIDLSEPSLERNRMLANQLGLTNLELRAMPIEDAASLDERFDHVVCTGVLHHLENPTEGLRALQKTIATSGAMVLMVYARSGRAGIEMIQEYCHRLGLGSSAADIDELVMTLRELPVGHPLSHLLRSSPDFQHPDALADALLHPRDCSYTVPEVFGLLEDAGMHFGRWLHQAPYLPQCGSLSEVPHGARIAALPIEDQYAAVELFRGTMTRHTLVAYGADAVDPIGTVDVGNPDWLELVPLRVTSAIAVEDRARTGAAAALLNTSHEFTDLVLLVDQEQLGVFEAIDGCRTIADFPGCHRELFERLWQHDLVVFEAPRSGR